MEAVWRAVTAYFDQAGHCVKQGINHTPCQDFWHGLGLFMVVTGALGTAAIVIFLLRRKRRAARATARMGKLAHLQQAIDEEELKKSVWVGEARVEPEISQEALAAEFRRALEGRK